MRALVLAALLTATPSAAAVTSSAPDAFISSNETLVAQPPAAVWTALINWGAWWDPAHSYSGKAGLMTLDARAGGTLSERWPGGSTQHAVVVNALPAMLLRLHGGFGPLQALPVTAVLDFALKPEAGATRLTMTYRVAGSATARLDALAVPVDTVMTENFARLVAFATTGKP